VNFAPCSSKIIQYSSSDRFQIFHSCFKYNSMNSIQWYNQILYSLNYNHKKNQNIVVFLLKFCFHIHLETSSKCLMFVPSIIRWALSNDVLGFLIVQTITFRLIDGARENNFVFTTDIYKFYFESMFIFSVDWHWRRHHHLMIASGFCWFLDGCITESVLIGWISFDFLQHKSKHSRIFWRKRLEAAR
jgi:hypothetical protein